MTRRNERADEPTRPKTGNAALPMDLLKMVRIVSTHRNETITKVLEDLLRPVLTREYRKVTAALSELGESRA